MKTMNLRFKQAALTAAVMLTAAVVPSFAQETPPATPQVLADGANAKSARVENMHMTRFLEIYLAAPDPKTGELVAACYNTMFTPQGIPANKDTCPQKLVEGLDFDKMKAKYGVVGASLNGPKY